MNQQKSFSHFGRSWTPSFLMIFPFTYRYFPNQMNFCNKSQTPNQIPLIILSKKHAHYEHFFSSLSFLLFNKPFEIAICSLGSPDFKWRWVMGRGKNKRPKKSVGLPTKPKKIPWSNFRAFIIYRKLKLHDTKNNGSGVQTDATTPNNVGTCSASWEEYNP